MLFDAKLIKLLREAAANVSEQEKIPQELLEPLLQIIKNPYTGHPLSYTSNIPPFADPYTAIGIDGSQIYPDRHSHFSFFLLHIAHILIEYRKTDGTVQKKGEPFLFTAWDNFQDSVATHDIVDAERFLHELSCGIKVAQTYQKNNPTTPCIIFIDGPLIFWHLSQKPTAFITSLFARYSDLLQMCESERIPLIGYTSRPRSKELVHSLKQFIEQNNEKFRAMQHCLPRLTDTVLLSSVLGSGMQSDLFLSQQRFLSDEYTKKQKILFYYLNTGAEMIRIELPQWLSKDESLLYFVFGAVKHQMQNGFGYPTVLALAHEEAVIKNHDRLFFINMLHKFTLQHTNSQPHTTQKQAKKDAGNRKTT